MVAEEIGELAKMSGNAASEIFALLESSVKRVQDIISSLSLRINPLVTQNNLKMNSSVEVIGLGRSAIEKIINKSADLKSQMDGMGITIQEQVVGIKEISNAIQLLQEGAEKTATGSKQI